MNICQLPIEEFLAHLRIIKSTLDSIKNYLYMFLYFSILESVLSMKFGPRHGFNRGFPLLVIYSSIPEKMGFQVKRSVFRYKIPWWLFLTIYGSGK